MRRWAKRALATLAALLLAGGAWIAWKMGHPPPPPAALQLPAAALAPGALRAQFFGTTTLLLRDGQHAVMVDALLTRPGMRQVLFGTIPSDPARVAGILDQGKVGPIDLLLISHSHYDHVLDAPEIARRTGAIIVGSPSTRMVALGAGLTAMATRVLAGGERLDAGEFHVTVFRSLHSPNDAIPGTIDAPVHPPARTMDYKTGGTFAFLIEHKGLRILVHPSANFVPGMYRGVRADVMFLAVGGLGGQSEQFTADYWRETVEATGAKLIIPIHFDDFLQPLTPQLQPLRRFMDDVPTAMARIEALANRDGVRIRTMPVIAPVDLAAALRSR